MKKIYFLFLIVILFSYGCGGPLFIPTLVGTGAVAVKGSDMMLDQTMGEVWSIRVKTENLKKLKQDVKEIVEAEGYKIVDSGNTIKLKREGCFKIKFIQISDYIKLEISDCSFFWNQMPGGRPGGTIEKGLVMQRLKERLEEKYKVLI